MASRKSEVSINVYDLLPPSYLSTVLWYAGHGLLHSGVVVNGKEYAYGGHDRRGVTGVYWTTPGLEPPGGTFRCGVVHGFTVLSDEEIDEVVTEASHLFLGPAWSLLENNCNHFTSYLCERLTGQPAPHWLNRAANIGMALPCVVPREWISPPEGDNEDGELVDEEEHNETVAMLRHQERGTSASEHDYDNDDTNGLDNSDDEFTRGRPATRKRSSKDKDSNGWPIPKSERAPVPS